MGRRALGLLLLAFGFASFARGEDAARPSWKMGWGSCPYENKGDGQRPSPAFLLCLNGQSQTDLHALNRGDSKAQLAHETQAFAALHYGEQHSLQASARYFAERPLDQGDKPQPSGSLPYLVYQYGTIYRDRLQVSVGKHVLPFGVERQPLIGLYSLYLPKQFWQGPDLGVNLTLSNAQSFFVQLGVFSEDKKLRAKALSARIFYERPSWQGTKAIASLYHHREGSKRLGLALVNSNADDRLIQVEFIRSYLHPNLWLSEFEQLLRLYLQSPRRHGNQFFCLFDEQRQDRRFASLGWRRYFKDFFSFQLALTFARQITSKADEEQRSQWGLVGGIGASI